MDMKGSVNLGSIGQRSISDGSTSGGIWSKTRKIAGLITIEPSLLILMTSIFTGNLLLNNLILYKACSINLGHNETFCEALINKPRGSRRDPAEEEVQNYVVDFQVWTSLIENIFPVFYVVFLGAWSDTYGRKVPYLLCIFGYILRYSLLILATYFTSWDAIVVDVLASLPVSLTGSRTALNMVIFSYVADTSSMKDRTLKIGMVGAVRGFGRGLGSALGGFLSGAEFGYYGIFGLAGAMDVFALVQAWFVIKDVRDETLVQGKTKWEAFRAVFNLNHIKDSAVAFVRPRPRGERARLFLLVAALMCTMLPMTAEESIIYNFSRLQLGWNSEIFGYYNTYKMLLSFIGGVASVGILSSWMNISDAIIGLLSSLSQIVASFIYCFADRDWMMYLAPLVDILNGTMIFAARSMISKIIPRVETGKINAVISTLDTITPIPANPIYNAIYSATLSTLPGAFFLFSAAVTVPALAIFTYLGIFRKRADRDPNLPEEIPKSVTECDSLKG